MESWERTITRCVAEAKEILRKNGYPTEWFELQKTNMQPSDQLIYCAIRIISAQEYLTREIEQGRIKYALSRFYSLVVAYEEMDILANVDGLKKQPLIASSIFDSLNTGVNRKRDLKKFGDERGQDQTAQRTFEWNKWIAEAERLKTENPALAGPRMHTQLARKIKNNLELEESVQTIRKRI